MYTKNNSDKLNVLISAAGSPLGQSIFKALQRAKLDLNIYLTDISNSAAGFYLNNPKQNKVLPLVKSPDYKEAFLKFIEEKKIDIYFPTISPEYEFVNDNEKEIQRRGSKIAGIDYETYQLCNDKHKCFEMLKESNIRIPYSFLASPSFELNEVYLPLILKPRFGASSNDIFNVKSHSEYNSIVSAYEDNYFLAQEYMGAPEEYTIGVYRSQNMKIEKAFIIKRELKFGLSYKGEVIESDELSKYAVDVCRALGTKYSANVQLKIHKDEPCLFEVNPRLSSTTSVRAKFGFNEPELMIRELLGNIHEYKWNMSKGKFMRYWEEIYVEA